jgi:hypothetical protein
LQFSLQAASPEIFGYALVHVINALFMEANASLPKREVVPVLFLTQHHAMKTYWGGGDISPRILYLGTRGGEWPASRPGHFTPQGKSLWYPLDRRLDGLQSRSGHGGEEKNSQLLPGLETPIIQPIAQRHTTELSQLPLKGNIHEIKVKFSLCLIKHHTLKILGDVSGGIVPRIVKFDRWCVIRFTLRPLYFRGRALGTYSM